MRKDVKTIKLQRRFAYRYKDREHFKHILTVPEPILEELGWEEGMELTPRVKGDKLLFENQANASSKLWSHKDQSTVRTFLLRFYSWLGGDETIILDDYDKQQA